MTGIKEASSGTGNGSLSLKKALRFGFDAWREHWITALFFTVLYSVVLASRTYFYDSLMRPPGIYFFSYFLIVVGTFLLGALLDIKLIKASLQIHRDDPVKIYASVDVTRWIKYSMANVAYSLIVAFGLILLIVPGFYWAMKYLFFDFAYVEETLGPSESFGRSAEITASLRWQLFGIWLLIWFLSAVLSVFLRVLIGSGFGIVNVLFESGIGVFAFFVLIDVYKQAKQTKMTEG